MRRLDVLRMWKWESSKRGKRSRFSSPTKPDALTKAAEGVVPINMKWSTVAVFVMWLNMLKKCAIFITWLQKCPILVMLRTQVRYMVKWLSQVCYIGHVTRKGVLYGEHRTGDAFDPPTQNTTCICSCYGQNYSTARNSGKVHFLTGGNSMQTHYRYKGVYEYHWQTGNP